MCEYGQCVEIHFQMNDSLNVLGTFLAITAVLSKISLNLYAFYFFQLYTIYFITNLGDDLVISMAN